MVKKIYGIVSVLLFLIAIVLFSIIDKTNSIKLSFIVQILLILYLSKTIWGCIIYIKEQYKKQKYSYSIIMNLGLVIFLAINIFRQVNLLFINWKMTSINDLYMNTLNSFSYFAFFILPLIAIIAIYSIFTNIFLIIKEGFSFQNILGILFGICIIIGSFASQFIYEIMGYFELNNSKIYIKKFVDVGLNSILCYFYCLTLATLYANIMAAKHKPNLDKDFAIILGAKVRDDGTLTPILRARVDKAIEFAKEQKEKSGKEIIFVPSGGQGHDEVISEAEAMKNYLKQKGISEDDIIVEDKSMNTVQNMRFSKNKIDELNKDGKIIFSTTNYHVFRSGVIANNEGVECEGIGCKTKWYFYMNALIREFIANIFSEKKRHIGLITSINIIMFILIFIGYKYNLILEGV
ncbi:MAG: YdcF family protein [Clostridia bacterium]|nr:YdcF family protein [Clostridia bacterium]